MDENVFQPADEIPAGGERPTVTFMGNTYDLISMGALTSGVLMAFMCATCNMGFYCLPFLPLLLGVIGLLTAQDSVDSKRSRLWSWIGLGTGGVIIILLVLVIVAYIGLVVVAVAVENGR